MFIYAISSQIQITTTDLLTSANRFYPTALASSQPAWLSRPPSPQNCKALLDLSNLTKLLRTSPNLSNHSESFWTGWTLPDQCEPSALRSTRPSYFLTCLHTDPPIVPHRFQVNPCRSNFSFPISRPHWPASMTPLSTMAKECRPLSPSIFVCHPICYPLVSFFFTKESFYTCHWLLLFLSSSVWLLQTPWYTGDCIRSATFRLLCTCLPRFSCCPILPCRGQPPHANPL